ncbi:MAG: SPOR domain-containing protein [Gammaproteobacteria bacterium]|nr:SPOR domain-containing protein [Gammaproteobacteria bacterium]MBI5615888.1 SPOR domain-containing protein [Gammaproteobacteria bacterium]
MDELDVQPDAKGSAVKITLMFPMRVLSWQPPKHGDLLHVQVQPILQPGIDACALTERQTLLWSATDQVPLVEATYEPQTLQVLDRTGQSPCQNGENVDPFAVNTAGTRALGSAEIALRFNRAVWYEVQQTDNPRELTVVLLGASEGKVDVDTTQEVEGEKLTPIVTEPANEPLNVPRTPAPPPESAAPPEQPLAEQNFFLSLVSSRETFGTGGVPQNPAFEGKRFFSSEIRKDGKPWYVLNVGFFADRAAADAVLAKVKIQFPEAQVLAATDRDRESAKAANIRPIGATPPAPEVPKPAGDRTAQLVGEARDDIMAKDFSTALRKLDAVAQDDKTPYRKEALELIGVARERALQYELAVVAYRRFLKNYPDGPDSDRVKQRLQGLLTQTQETRETLRLSRQEKAAGGKLKPATAAKKPAAPPEDQKWSTDVMGGVSQTWRRENQYTSGGGMEPVTSMLQNYLDVNTRMQKNNLRGRARLNAGYTTDLLANTRFKNRNQFSNVYFEMTTKDRGWLGRVGRQSTGSGGVLGRFDGGVASYAVNKKVKLNVVGGLPVESSSNAPPNDDKFFYGINADIGQLWGAWDFNAYLIEQRAYGFLDRRAVGGEARYFKNNLSVFSLIDVDASYGELNSLLLLGNYLFQNRASMNASFDFRKSPYVLTTDALQGQGVTNLTELRQTFTENQIRDLAADRAAARSTTLSIGGYYPFNDRVSINSDFTTSRVSGTPESGGVPRTPATDWDFIYSTQLLVSNLPRESDTAILGAQYGDFNTTSMVTCFIGTRNAITPQLRIAPTLRFSHSEKLDGTEDWTLAPDIQLDYRLRRNIQLQLEGGMGYGLLGQAAPLGYSHFNEYFIIAGWRLDF